MIAGSAAASTIAPSYPKAIAKIAPTAGPTVFPRYCAPVVVLRLVFSRESGTLTLISATEAGTKPDISP
jgi:hypothetical protein